VKQAIEERCPREAIKMSAEFYFFGEFFFPIFTLLPNINASKRVTVNWVWQKNMMYNKSGFAGD
jgi:hypothetical protein